MKTIFRVFSACTFLLILSFGIQSCSKDDGYIQDIPQAMQTGDAITPSEKALEGDKVTIKCESTCSDGQSDCIMNGQGQVVSCSCSGCTMILIVRGRQGDITEYEVEDLSYAVSHLAFFQ